MNNELSRALKVGISALAVIAAIATLSGCAKESTPASGEESITIYSGRSEDLISPLLDQFTNETGIGVEVRLSLIHI